MIERLTSEEGNFRLVVPNFDGGILVIEEEARGKELLRSDTP